MDSQKEDSVGQKRPRPEWKSELDSGNQPDSVNGVESQHLQADEPCPLTPHTLRLLKLIEEGTASHAKLAASHLTCIAATSSPEVLWDLLGRLQAYLQSTDWTCRVNASVALQGVAQHIPPQDQVNFLKQTFDVDENLWLNLRDLGTQPDGNSGLDTILLNGRLLLATSESTYDVSLGSFEAEMKELEKLDASQEEIRDFVQRRVAVQRRILARRLGLIAVAEAIGSTSEVLPDTITQDDLLMDDPIARQKQHIERVRKRCQREESTMQQATSVRTLLVMEMREQNKQPGLASSHRNPQTILATELIYRMFDPVWHVRHGALLGTLALLRAWNKAVRHTGEAAFGVWPQDIMARCLCVLALDRFGDYGGGSGGALVAPVREVAAQLLSVLWSLAHLTARQDSLDIICRLGRYHCEWEVRHGSLLALMYIVVFLSQRVQLENDEVLAPVLGRVVEAALRGLSDVVDDVRSVSAQVLSYLLNGFTATQVARGDIIRSCCASLLSTVERIESVKSSPADMILLFTSFLSLDCQLVLETLATSCSVGGASVRAGLLDILSRVLGSSDSPSVSQATLGAIENVADSEVLVLSGNRHDTTILPWSASRLLQTVFSTYFSPEFECRVGDEKHIELQSTLRIARDKCWSKLAIQTRALLTKHTPARNNLLLKLVRQYLGTQNPLSLDISGRETQTTFQWSAARGLIGLMSELVANDSRIDAFLMTIILASFGSPSCRRYEAACILFQTICSMQVLDLYPESFRSGIESLHRDLRLSPPCISQAVSSNVFEDVDAVSCTDAWPICHMSCPEGNDSTTPGMGDLVAELVRMLRRTEARPEPVGSKVSCNEGIEEMRVRATVAGSITAAGPDQLPEKLTTLIRALMTSMKSEVTDDRISRTCESVVQLIGHLSSAMLDGKRMVYEKVRSKVLDNICNLACSSRSTHSTTCGAACVIETVVSRLPPGSTLSGISPIWRRLGPLLQASSKESDEASLIESIQILSIVSRGLRGQSYVLSDLISAVVVPLVTVACTSPSSSLRQSSTQILASITAECPEKAFLEMLPSVFDKLQASDNDAYRYGTCQMIHAIIDTVGMKICPFVRRFLPVAMSLMVDPVVEISRQAAQTFSLLVRIAPLVQHSISSDSWPHMDDDVKSDKVIEHLIHGKALPPIELPVKVLKEIRLSGISLRRYQLEGISWLDFLRAVKLNGALCDDLGLGKSVQALIAIATSHVRSSDVKMPSSLIVCPSSLIGHWVAEIAKFFPSGDILCGMPYTSRTKDGFVTRDKKYNVVITSYSILRTDVGELSRHFWNYCVLDEGHLMKNPKTATAIAVREIRSRHRLILTGTPVQNRVQELWAVFDFLMPNFLGTHVVFSKEFGRPIAKGQATGASAGEIKHGIDKLKLLHQQVLPFVLRREKQHVLSELPPKSIIDVPCILSGIQERLYKQYCKDRQVEDSIATLRRSLSGPDNTESSSSGSTIAVSALVSLLYLRLLCTHPVLVVSPSWRKELGTGCLDASYVRLDCSGKLVALHELLRSAHIVDEGPTGADNDVSAIYCEPSEPDTEDGFSAQLGIGDSLEDDANASVCRISAGGESPKCLIFAQFTRSLDVVEEFLFRPQMPSLRYLRLDGSVPFEKRGELVNFFNTDSSIKVMLLTTKVGGLGLNLTGASIVIFLEHDYNAHADLQAADRAHRLGQTKAVSVYRLITKDTIEEEIMKLQDSKLAMSRAIVNTENSSMYSMGTDRLLDIFTFQSDKKQAKHPDEEGPNVNSLVDLCNAEEYDSLSVEEFLGGFRDMK